VPSCRETSAYNASAAEVSVEDGAVINARFISLIIVILLHLHSSRISKLIN
jgi:hypothetical protein